jgi:hypothetical protein
MNISGYTDSLTAKIACDPTKLTHVVFFKNRCGEWNGRTADAKYVEFAKTRPDDVCFCKNGEVRIFTLQEVFGPEVRTSDLWIIMDDCELAPDDEKPYFEAFMASNVFAQATL